MPYANGPLHLGHLAGAQLPADIHARWMGMLIGRENVLFVNGTDDHGSTSEVSAAAAGVPIRQFIDAIHAQQRATLQRYSIGLDVYTGTSRPECFPLQKQLSDYFLRRLHANGLLEKRTSRQWYDTQLNRFLPDRLVRGTCPNPKCGFDGAYSDECDRCGHQHEPTELINPKSVLSGTDPRDAGHRALVAGHVVGVRDPAHLDRGQEEDSGAPRSSPTRWRRCCPSLRFEGEHEPRYKELKASLPPHKSKYAPGKQLVLQFNNKPDLDARASKRWRRRASNRCWPTSGPTARSPGTSPGASRCRTSIPTWRARPCTSGPTR